MPSSIKHIALAGVALIVHVQRAAAIGDGAVVQHRHTLGRHPLPDATGKGARALAVEVAFQSVAHCFVQQDAGPARPEHHGHFAGWRCPGLQVAQRRLHRLVHILGHQRVVEIGQAKAPATAGRAHFAAAFLLGNDRQAQPHQGPHIGGQGAVGSRHHHHVVFHRQASHHLHDAPVLGLGQTLDLFEQGHLGGAVQRGDRIKPGIQ
jgi:hypothetical protein